MNKIGIYILSAAFALLTLASCEHKELCYDHSHVVSLRVRFDWTNAPEASPATMSVYLFSKKEPGEPLRYELRGRDGSVIRVPEGDYDLLCLNSDTEGLTYRGTGSWATFEVTPHDADLFTSGLASLGLKSDDAPRAEGTEGERVTRQADELWHDARATLTLREGGRDSVLTLYPEQAHCRYRVEISEAENLKYVSGLSAALSGIAGGVTMADGVPSDERVTMPFEMRAVGTVSDGAVPTDVTGELLTFSHQPLADNDRQHVLVVYAVLADGSKFAYTYDAAEVTRQIREAEDPYDVVIRLKGLPLPKPITNGGGFQPTVDEWEEEEITIGM